MKPLHVFSLLHISAAVATAQTNTFPVSGNVGIGTTGPASPLQIGSPANLNPADIKAYGKDGSNRVTIGVYSAVDTNFRAEMIAAYSYAHSFQLNTLGGEVLGVYNGNTFLGVGNVGIGTTNPSCKFQVATSTAVSGLFYGLKIRNPLDASYDGGGSGVGIVFEADCAKGAIAYERKASWGRGALHFLQNNTADASAVSLSDSVMSITQEGNVGIATMNPTEKLSVNGRIRAKEVIVDTNWSDYVFAKGYKLASLSEVEQKIQQSGHLPGVPSATEVAEKGVSIGDMQAILLAKIEELTLHQIAQEKRLATQDAKIESQAAEIARLKAAVP